MWESNVLPKHLAGARSLRTGREKATWEGVASAAPGKQTGGSRGETVSSDPFRPEDKRHKTETPTPDLSISEERQNNSSGSNFPHRLQGMNEVICLKMYTLSEQTGLGLLSGQCSFRNQRTLREHWIGESSESHSSPHTSYFPAPSPAETAEWWREWAWRTWGLTFTCCGTTGEWFNSPPSLQLSICKMGMRTTPLSQVCKDEVNNATKRWAQWQACSKTLMRWQILIPTCLLLPKMLSALSSKSIKSETEKDTTEWFYYQT